MSEEQSSVPRVAQGPQVPQGVGWPEGRRWELLAQMDLLMAALNADLSALDAELQGAGAQGVGPQGWVPHRSGSGEGAARRRRAGVGERRSVNGGHRADGVVGGRSAGGLPPG